MRAFTLFPPRTSTTLPFVSRPHSIWTSQTPHTSFQALPRRSQPAAAAPAPDSGAAAWRGGRAASLPLLLLRTVGESSPSVPPRGKARAQQPLGQATRHHYTSKHPVAAVRQWQLTNIIHRWDVDSRLHASQPAPVRAQRTLCCAHHSRLRVRCSSKWQRGTSLTESLSLFVAIHGTRCSVVDRQAVHGEAPPWKARNWGSAQGGWP